MVGVRSAVKYFVIRGKSCWKATAPNGHQIHFTLHNKVVCLQGKPREAEAGMGAARGWTACWGTGQGVPP